MECELAFKQNIRENIQINKYTFSTELRNIHSMGFKNLILYHLSH